MLRLFSIFHINLSKKSFGLFLRTTQDQNPSLGWVRLKEKGYIPTTKDGYVVKSGSVSIKAGRYYISALVEVPDIPVTNSFSEGIGIDLGVKDFAIRSDGRTFKSINKQQN